VINTYFQLGDYERVLSCGDKNAPLLEGLALAELGRVDEGLTLLRTVGQKAPPRMRDFMEAAVMAVERRGRPDAAMLALLERSFFHHVKDPEGLYYASRHMALLGEREIAMREFTRAVDGGYACYPLFVRDSWLDDLRGLDSFRAVMARAKQRYLDAVKAFKSVGGERIVGVRIEPVD
jgi:hypothetical protein